MSVQTILAIDTATENCSVALGHNGKIFLKSEVAPQKHANLVLGMIDELLTENNVDRSAIDAIGFGSGPGSFTGVRIAVSTAQGLALGLDKKVFGLSDLKLLVVKELLAKGTSQEPCFGLGCIDARMGEVYLALYSYDGQNINTVISEQVLKPEDAIAKLKEHQDKLSSNLVLAGSGIAILQSQDPQLIPGEVKELYPQADAIIACAQVEKVDLRDPSEAEPLYCRNEVTWKKIGEQ